jgi:hypothetical protein
MGLKPGPVFGKILKKVEEKQLDGDLTSKEDAIKWIKRMRLSK